MRVTSWIPALDWLRQYDRPMLKGDLAAGLTVGVMLIPQGMAYAMIAGLPPIYGLYASTIPLIIYAFLGSSRQLAVGPVAMVSLLTATGIGAMAADGTEEYIMLAISLALLVGAIQLLIGLFRLGFLVNFLSHPVISGFTSAAALIIGLSQLKHLLGIEIERTHHVHEILWQAAMHISEVNWITVVIGVGGILLIVFSRKINPSIPGPLLVVALGILSVWGLSLFDLGVKIVGEVPSGLPSFGLPRFDWNQIEDLLPIALAIAFVSFLESIAVAKAVQSKHKDYRIDANQELIALGMSNIGGSFWQSYPVTGGFSRTAVNDQAGAKSGMASIVSASIILLTLLFLTSLFYYLPNAVLASVIMVAVFGLIDVKEAIDLWSSDRADFWMLLATFISTLALGIEEGIGVGVILSLAMMIYRTSRPHVAQLGKVPGTSFYRNIARFDHLENKEDLLIIRFDGPLFFANIEYFKSTLEEKMLEKGSELKLIVLHAGGINHMDSSAMAMMKSLVADLRHEGLDLYLCGVTGPIRDALAMTGFTKQLGPDHFFMDVEQAIAHFHLRNIPESKGANPHAPIILQTNTD